MKKTKQNWTLSKLKKKKFLQKTLRGAQRGKLQTRRKYLQTTCLTQDSHLGGNKNSQMSVGKPTDTSIGRQAEDMKGHFTEERAQTENE